MGEKEALKWCQQKSVIQNSIYEKLGLSSFLSFEKSQKDLLQRGRKLVKDISLEMGGEGALDLLYRLILNIQPENVLETGVSFGWSSLAVLSAMNENGKGRLISTDMPYPKMNNEDFVGIVVPHEFHSNWELLRIPDRVGIPQAITKAETFELIHYDSDKSYEGRKWAYPLLWEVLTGNGYLVSDDISDNSAFMKFCQSKNLEPLVFEIKGKFVGILKKGLIEIQ